MSAVKSRSSVVMASTLDVLSPFEGLVRITPEDATGWLLQFNSGNRRIRARHVIYLAREMKAGEWLPDHPQPIVFSTQRLIDGQHRLAAVAQSGVIIDAKLVCGVRDELRGYIDTGISRTISDRLEFDSDPVVNTLIGNLLNTMWFHKSGKNNKLTPLEAQRLFEDNEEAIKFVARQPAAKTKGVGRVFVRIALMEMYQRDPVKAEEFADSLFVPDGPVQPARMLRDYLLRNSASSRAEEMRNTYNRAVAAMKAHLEGRTIQVVRSAKWD